MTLDRPLPLRIALLQLLADGNNRQSNLEKGVQACRQAAAAGADVALFPEMWSIGYYEWGEAGASRDDLARQAIDASDEFVQRHQELAKELDLAICLTYLGRSGVDPCNSLALIDRHGVIRLEYTKVHTCDFADEAQIVPGDSFGVADLDTRAGQVKIGAMICFDLLFPEAARALMLDGAEVILVPNASRNDDNHLVCLRARAHENMCAIALANYAAPQQTGRSVLFDGVSYDIDQDGAPTVDPTIVMAGAGEDVLVGDLDLVRLRAFREAETQGDAYRKPRTYLRLVDTGPAHPPFARDDARR